MAEKWLSKNNLIGFAVEDVFPEKLKEAFNDKWEIEMPGSSIPELLIEYIDGTFNVKFEDIEMDKYAEMLKTTIDGVFESFKFLFSDVRAEVERRMGHAF